MAAPSATDILQAAATTHEPAPGIIVATPLPSPIWNPGDYKMSALAADHADPSGGSWLLCDGTAFPSTAGALIALLGANRPDAQGRTLVMKGTHADVSTLLDSDGLSAAKRRPTHNHSLGTANYGLQTGGTFGSGSSGDTVGPIEVGPQTGFEPTDTPAYLVPGNLFIHT